MSIAEILLLDFDIEVANTRRLLERIPEHEPQWKPHEKSMPLGRLALHVARLPDFWSLMATTPALDMATHKFPDLIFESTAQLLSELERSSAQAKAHLLAMSDDALREHWKLSFGPKVFVDAPKMVLYRSMFLNHMIHHRGQLTVYLRLRNIAIPGLYGPSADEKFG
jgi:uncharacterized damage-inducible protein DinB